MGCSSSKIRDSNGTANTLQCENAGKVETVETGASEAPQVRVESISGTDDAGTDSQATTRLLLLGAAESGKTTVLEQIRLLYNQNYSDAELLHRRTFIYANIVSSMFEMLAYMKEVNEQLGDPSNAANVQMITEEMDGASGRFSDAQLKALKALWDDSGIQAIYSRRGEFNLNDSIKYFYENLDRINAIDFKPTPRDIIMAYCPTAGVQNVNFTVNDHTYQ